MHCMHIIRPKVILNHIEKHPKIEGRFSHGETLYRRWGDSISMEETLFQYRVSGGRLHFSQGENLFRGRLYFVTSACHNAASFSSRQSSTLLLIWFCESKSLTTSQP